MKFPSILVPKMEEVSTTLINSKGVSIPISTNRTPRVNDFILPPIGENEFINMNKKSAINMRNSSTGAKSQRADSGIGELDHQHGNSGWISPVNGSDNGEITNKENNQKRNGLKKNPTSSTLYSYGQSSNQSKQAPSVFSSKNSHNVENSNNNSNNKPSHKFSNLNNKNEDTVEHVVKLRTSPTLTRNNTEPSEQKPTISRQNSQLARKNSLKQLHHQQQPTAKPRQTYTGEVTQRSNSLQRQQTFMTDAQQPKNNSSTNTNSKQQLHKRNSFTGTNKLKTQNNNNNNNHNNSITRPSTSTSNNYQQQKTSKVNSAENNENNNNYEAEIKPPVNDCEYNESTKKRIYEWLDEVERLTQLRPPSALSWFGGQNNSTKVASNKKNEEVSTRNESHDPEFDLSEYDSSDEQIVEYNRVVDKTYCVVYEQ